MGLNTMWDDQLSYLLTPSLAAYETERTTGIQNSSILIPYLTMKVCRIKYI